MRKIFLFFVFFLFIFLSLKQNASAALPVCEIKDGSPLFVTNNDIRLTGTMQGKDVLISGRQYQIIFAGQSLRLDYYASGQVSGGNATANNGEIKIDHTFPWLKNGGFTIYVADVTSPIDPSSPVFKAYCASSTYQIQAYNAGGSCTISVKSTNNYKTNATESFNATFTAGIENNSRETLVYRDGNDITGSISSFNGQRCQSVEALTKGFDLGQLTAGTYSIKIKTGCYLSGLDCSTPDFTISTEGGGGPGPAQEACYSCPPGCAYSEAFISPGNTTRTCKNTSTGATCTVREGYCDPDTQVCDPNHTGCISSYQGVNYNCPAYVTDCNKAAPPVKFQCAIGTQNGTCDTAIGNNIGTTPKSFVKSLFSIVLGIVGGIAVILIIISGYRLMTSAGNPERVQGAKEQLTAAIIGLLFIIFSLVILETLGVDILGLPGVFGG